MKGVKLFLLIALALLVAPALSQESVEDPQSQIIWVPVDKISPQATYEVILYHVNNSYPSGGWVEYNATSYYYPISTNSAGYYTVAGGGGGAPRTYENYTQVQGVHEVVTPLPEVNIVQTPQQEVNVSTLTLVDVMTTPFSIPWLMPAMVLVFLTMVGGIRSWRTTGIILGILAVLFAYLGILSWTIVPLAIVACLIIPWAMDTMFSRAATWDEYTDVSPSIRDTTNNTRVEQQLNSAVEAPAVDLITTQRVTAVPEKEEIKQEGSQQVRSRWEQLE